MKKKLIVLALSIVLICSAILSVNALPPGCPECGEPGYHQVYVTYNYGFLRFEPCIHGENHQDSVYHLWRYTYNACDECGFTTPKVYFEGDWYLCPGEPIPDLVDPEPLP